MIGHGKEICACGAVIRQCRCIQGHGAPRIVCQTCPQCLAATAAAIVAFEPPDEAEKELAKLSSTYIASEEVYLRAKARYDETLKLWEDATLDLRAARVARDAALDIHQLALIRARER
jgi:hypothetical protein